MSDPLVRDPRKVHMRLVKADRWASAPAQPLFLARPLQADTPCCASATHLFEEASSKVPKAH